MFQLTCTLVGIKKMGLDTDRSSKGGKGRSKVDIQSSSHCQIKANRVDATDTSGAEKYKKKEGDLEEPLPYIATHTQKQTFLLILQCSAQL